MKTKDMVYSALGAAVIAALGLVPPIPLPFIPVPITMQTMGIMLAGSFLGKKLGFFSTMLFTALVLAGLPLLSGGRGGVSVLFGPTGGYFIIWPIAAFVIGLLCEHFWGKINVLRYVLINFAGGILLINLVGGIYLSFVTGISPVKAVLSSAIFIPGDLVKAFVVSLICSRLKFMSPMNER